MVHFRKVITLKILVTLLISCNSMNNDNRGIDTKIDEIIAGYFEKLPLESNSNIYYSVYPLSGLSVSLRPNPVLPSSLTGQDESNESTSKR